MINKVILIGNTGGTADVKMISDTKVAKLSLATTQSWKDSAGAWHNKTTWHNLIGWRGLADLMAKIGKGEKIYVEGSIDTREYMKDDEKRYATDIVIDTLRRLESRNDSASMPSEVPEKWMNDKPVQAKHQSAVNDLLDGPATTITDDLPDSF